MSKRFFSILAIILLLAMLPVLGSADIAAKSGNLALFLKPTWSTGSATQGHWEWDNTHEWYVEGTSPEGHGGRKFYQYEDYAGKGILYTVKPSAKGLPQDYKHKGTVVVAEIGWGKQTPLSAQDVWDIWEEIPDTYRYRKGGVTQIQLLSDELRGVCYELDNKYGSRDLRILVYGAKLTNDREQDKALVREQMETALSGECLKTKR
ncbi:MAG: hypothetical protein IJ175_10860 [Clostridia bacterium]|nr:hypothetical protein [Clostridia bacterium]